MYTTITQTVYQVVANQINHKTGIVGGQDIILWSGRNTTKAVARKAMKKLMDSDSTSIDYTNFRIDVETEEVEVYCA